MSVVLDEPIAPAVRKSPQAVDSQRVNILLNLLGQGAPLLAGVIAMPWLVKSLGTDRIGVLAIAWVLIGYFGLFDLGIGRALTRQISLELANSSHEAAPQVARAGLIMLGGLGIVAALLVGALASWLGHSVMNVPETMTSEVVLSLLVLSSGVPFTILGTGLTAILEAHQRFLAINAVKIPLGALLFLGPLVAAQFSPSLPFVVLSLVLSRAAAAFLLLAMCLPLIEWRRQEAGRFRERALSLLSFGGWLTLSNVIGPLMLYADRFLVAAVVSLSAVAYYALPLDVITKLLVIPSAILGVMFPVFARVHIEGKVAASKVYVRTLYGVGLVLLPAVAIVMWFASVGLKIWLGDDFARNSTLVSQILALGVLMNGFGLVSQAFIQACGRPDLTAKLHLVELPLYVCYLVPLLKQFGIVGAGLAWFIRTTLSAGLLAWIAQRTLSSIKSR